jgi:uncharacterized protein (TIGR02246 family)
MKTCLLFALTGWAIGFSLPCSAQSKDTADPQVANKLVSFYGSALTEQFDEALNRKDATALAALFTEDAVEVTPDGIFVGREAIRQRFADLFLRQQTGNYFGTREQLNAIGDDLWAVGKWWALRQSQNGPKQIGGYWSNIYVHEGNAWKIRMSTFNTTPLKTAAAETD